MYESDWNQGGNANHIFCAEFSRSELRKKSENVMLVFEKASSMQVDFWRKASLGGATHILTWR